MIIRNFEGKKYLRTYVGGSREKELETFLKVQGTKEDNSECDWLEYRRIFTAYFNDVLHVLLSWQDLVRKLSILTVILCALFFKIQIVFFILIGILIVLQIVQINLKLRQSRHANNYDLGLDITLSEIHKQTGFQLDKN